MPIEIICVLTTAFIFGITPLFERWLLHGSDFPLAVAMFARSLPATIMAACFLFLSGDATRLSTLQMRSWAIFGVLGILGSLVGPWLLFVAYRQPGGNISLIAPLLGTFPLFSILAGTLILGEAVSRTQAIGIVLLLSGAALVSWR